jgi:hypothetical protein
MAMTLTRSPRFVEGIAKGNENRFAECSPLQVRLKTEQNSIDVVMLDVPERTTNKNLPVEVDRANDSRSVR